MDRISQVRCVSAYQNDLWPDVSKTHLRAQPSTAIIRFSPCKGDSRGDEFFDRIVDDKSFEWGRVVPVTQRLEPKICSTKIRPFPEVEPARYEQPRKCVKKVKIYFSNFAYYFNVVYNSENQTIMLNLFSPNCLSSLVISHISFYKIHFNIKPRI